MKINLITEFTEAKREQYRKEVKEISFNELLKEIFMIAEKVNDFRYGTNHKYRDNVSGYYQVLHNERYKRS